MDVPGYERRSVGIGAPASTVASGNTAGARGAIECRWHPAASSRTAVARLLPTIPQLPQGVHEGSRFQGADVPSAQLDLAGSIDKQ
jgi:hypothetical protein